MNEDGADTPRREVKSAWEIMLPDESATEDLGRFLAEFLLPGDIVALSGGLGGGKTTLARALVRELAGTRTSTCRADLHPDPALRGGRRRPIVHADLYRLRSPDELVELGFDEMTETAITLVEWPERLGDRDGPILAIDLSLRAEYGDGARFARIDGSGGMAARLRRARALRVLLVRSGWDEAARTNMQGDASSRAYERLVKPDGRSAVLMISPPRADGPPVRNGRPYSAIVKLAESVHAFVGVDRGLRALGFSAPRIYGEDLSEGLLIIEDLGSEPVVDANGPRPERYAEAVRLLAKLHATELPGVLPVADGIDHVLPPYDLEALVFETELMPDWYCPAIRGAELSGPARAEFVGLWAEVLDSITPPRPTWTLRDYHSPNLIWLPEREGLERIGLIDFQDAVLGHPAYDVASLLQDARVDASAEFELRLLASTCASAAPASPTSTCMPSPGPTRSWRPSAPPRSSASSRASTGATASRVTSRTCRASRATLRATSTIRPLTHLRLWHEAHLPHLVPKAPPDPAEGA